MSKCNHGGIVVRDNAEAVVKEPMSVFAKGNSVSDVVVSGLGKLVNVGGINNAARVDSKKPIALQSAGIIIITNYVYTKSPLASNVIGLLARLAGSSLRANLALARNRNADQRTKIWPLIFWEIRDDQ